MKDIPQLINVAVELRTEFNDFCKNAYEYAKDKVKFSFDDLVVDTDKYVQAILFNVALADGAIVSSEFDFLHKIVEAKDYFAEVNFANLSAEEKNKLVTQCDKIGDSIPLFCKLAVASDKKADEELKIVKPTYSQIAFDFVRRITTYLKFVDGVVVTKEDKVARNDLENLIQYFKKEHVRYSTNRQGDLE